MNPDSLLLAAEMLAALAILLLLVQWAWSRSRQRHQLRQRTRQRLDVHSEPEENGSRLTVGLLEGVLLRADIHLSQGQLTVLAIMMLLFLAVVVMLKGPLAALVSVVIIVVLLWMYWRIRLQQQRRRIYEELPMIIDATLRYIEAGRSLENALMEAFRDTPPVFERLTFRLHSAVESGRDYTELFEEFARLHEIPTLVTVAIALRTSQRFGSSIKPVLKQVAVALRAQQELRREFMAATSEIRFTAVAFALLPLGLAAYMVLMNESYSRVLLDTDTGHTMLIVAGGLQLTGIAIIWRMIQGVGRG